MAAGFARREVLRLLGTGAGVAAFGVPLPEAFARPRLAPRRARAGGSVPSCVVRPQQMEGPFFLDEKLERSDIRSDPSDGSVRPGTPLALTFVVSRLDGALCSPFEGVFVDVWQCDAAGQYAGVVDGGFDTTGKQFLRGYQVTDAAGTASFVTIYPGWYTGRTVHIHFKLRTAPEEAAALEFTSQLYFDDAASDIVLAEEPYASRGERTVRNEDDAIYRTNGAQLLLAVEPDGSGGYAATFTIGLQMDPEACGSVAGCVEALRATLPGEGSAADAKTRRTARRLARRLRKTAKLLERAAEAAGPAQAARYEKARRRLAALLDASRRADGAGTLGVALAPIEAAVATLVALLPS